MRLPWDILSFQVYVTPGLLILVYYLGAIGIPLLVLRYTLRARDRIAALADAHREHLPDLPSPRLPGSGRRPWLYALLFFVLLELCWRMMIEFLLAYFDIRAALVGIRTG